MCDEAKNSIFCPREAINYNLSRYEDLMVICGPNTNILKVILSYSDKGISGVANTLKLFFTVSFY